MKIQRKYSGHPRGAAASLPVVEEMHVAFAPWFSLGLSTPTGTEGRSDHVQAVKDDAIHLHGPAIRPVACSYQSRLIAHGSAGLRSDPSAAFGDDAVDDRRHVHGSLPY